MSGLSVGANRVAVDVLIVGAGLTGLMAARRLRDAGRTVCIVNEGSAPGGRLATSAVGAGWADAGAQFFTVRAPEFSRLVEGWQAEGWVYEWSRGWSAGSLLAGPPDGYPRYAARGGFGALAAHLADGLDVRLSTRLVSVVEKGRGWLASDERGAPFAAHALILTPPAPQSLALLDAGGVELPAAERAALEAIEYGPCLCGLFELTGEIALPAPGALQRPGHAISWIADNRRKGISPGAPVVTVHAGPAASAEYWQRSDEEVLTWMLAELRLMLEPDVEVRAACLRRWRYAVPLTTHPRRCLRSEGATPLVFAGDAFDGPRVEGAALSGLAAANCLR